MPSRLIASLALLAATPALAQTAPAPAAADTRSYDIPPGPLSPALARFAGQAGVTLSADPALTEGLNTPGLHGRHGVLDGFAQLLQGTGLAVGQVGARAFVLRRLGPAQARSAAASAATLAAVTVTAQAVRSDATEGTGSYVAQSSTIGSKTGQPLREVPQSVSVVARQQIDDLGLATLPDALRAMPGVTVFGTALLTDRSLSRGFEMGANMRVDGGAVAELRYGIDNDLAFYDRVEVLRGADGLFGGNGEPGGVTWCARSLRMRKKSPCRASTGATTSSVRISMRAGR
jgi:outer membrane receptor for ferric coprogen and ferric-rhodotorulic acid